MCKLYILLILAVIILLGLNCNDSHILISVDADLGETIEIRFDGVVRIASENLIFGMTDQLVESRCPANAYCFWAGQVEAQFWFLSDMSDTLYSTAIYSPGGATERNARIPCYQLIIENIEPYPQDFDLIPLRYYRIYARVEKVECFDTSTIIMPVQFSELPPGQLQNDGFVLQFISIQADTLRMTFDISGGCNEHEFILYMNPVFMESSPVQANLYLYHNDFEDHCEAWWTETVYFDLTSIAELYKAYYGEYDDIVLNVYKYFQETPGDKLTVTYTP